MRVKNRKFAILLLIVCPVHTLAQSNSFALNTGIRYFDYAEYDNAGAFLDGETGAIAGLGGVFTRHLSGVQISLFGDLFQGKVEYDGQTQVGVPLTTETKAAFYSLGAGLKAPLPALSNRIEVFGDIRYQAWERDILPKGEVSGLYEIYRWWELALGAEFRVVKESDINLSVFTRVFHIISPSMQVDLALDGYGKPVLGLGEKVGGELGIRWVKPVSTTRQIEILGAYKFWEFGRSADKKIVRDDKEAVITIHEPRSESNTFTVQVIFVSYF